jgi:tRNA threonylcarbamoyladenosine biosynthesis protein TsaE
VVDKKKFKIQNSKVKMTRQNSKLFISNSPQETQNLAKDLLNSFNSHLICLYGELGSGKTTFVQGLAKSLGIKKRIISPTFIIIKGYQIPEARGKKGNCQLAAGRFLTFYHIDLYRVASKNNIEVLGLEELWSDLKNLIIIEWPEKIENILPKKRIDIKFNYEGKNKRKICVVYRHQQ